MNLLVFILFYLILYGYLFTLSDNGLQTISYTIKTQTINQIIRIKNNNSLKSYNKKQGKLVL